MEGSISREVNPCAEKRMVFDYYLSLLQKNGAKHNHKESSAWGGLVLYAFFCGALISTNWNSPGHTKLPLFITVGWVTVLTVYYLRNQLQLKDQASSRISASSFILSEIITDPDFSSEKYVSMKDIPPSLDKEAGAGSLPNYFLEKAIYFYPVQVKNDSAIKRTQIAVYALMLATFSVTVVTLWIKLYK